MTPFATSIIFIYTKGRGVPVASTWPLPAPSSPTREPRDDLKHQTRTARDDLKYQTDCRRAGAAAKMPPHFELREPVNVSAISS